MKLLTGYHKINSIVEKPFSTILEEYNIKDIKLNKGLAGILLERLIGLNQKNNLTDFIDGELKTNKVNKDAKPLETLCIGKISCEAQAISQGLEFEQSRLFKKLEHLLYVPVVKESLDPLEWYFLSPSITNLRKNKKLYNLIRNDFYLISKSIQNNLKVGKSISPCQGELIQIRTKDSKPYSPISINGVEVSDKNYAFYGKKSLIKYLQNN